ncbi:MAG: aminoglycoside phosphotransferase family protein [Thermomicrobia bacterium]|nr:aminoglycoside phosphotransferase family protein [Thermomicrobia bacterium]MCA1725160.1 aminoglycoside phosphotransferase family protein [Thermomicrobia bacterium]
MIQTNLDPLVILAALGVMDATAATPVSGGQDTAIWRVNRPGGRYALRVFAAGEERKCAREVATMRAAAAGGIPVPILHVEGAWQGRPALLLSWCAGQTLFAPLRTHPQRAWQLGVIFGRMQTRLHAIPLPEAPPYAPNQWLDWGGALERPLRERLLAVARRPLVLCHFDYHPLNVMTDGTHVTAVLDWPNGLPGDPRADLARTIVLMRFVRPSLRPHEEAVVRCFLRAWWHGYHQGRGSLGEMAPFYAWAGDVTVRDQERKIGIPGIALQSADLDPLRRWTNQWKRRSGTET